MKKIPIIDVDTNSFIEQHKERDIFSLPKGWKNQTREKKNYFMYEFTKDRHDYILYAIFRTAPPASYGYDISISYKPEMPRNYYVYLDHNGWCEYKAYFSSKKKAVKKAYEIMEQITKERS